MALTLTQKLGIKEGMTLITIHAPDDFADILHPLPKNVSISGKSKQYQQIHWFVKNKAEMEKGLKNIIAQLKEGVVCWIYYPKGSSKIQSDLTRDKGWEVLLAYKNLQWINLISFNDIWSAFGMRLKTEADEKKEAMPREKRPIFDYIDAVAKKVILPDDLTKELKKSKNAKQFFEALSFTNKKEYVEWIVTAKREETRQTRVSGTIERLEKGWKNPRNI